MKKLGTILLVILLCVGLAACSNDSSNESVSVTVDEDTLKYYFKDEVAVLEDVKIEITNCKVISAGKKGNEYGEKPIIAFWYKVKNTCDDPKKEIDPTTAWMATFTAIQDNDPNLVNELQMGSLPDEKYLETQVEQIKQGKRAECAVSYELDDKKTPVVLKAAKGIGGETLGEQTYQLD